MTIPTLPLLTTSPLCSLTKESAYLMDLIQLLNMIDKPYRVFYLVTELGWIDVHRAAVTWIPKVHWTFDEIAKMSPGGA